MITTKKFLDTRTNEVVSQFSILDIKYMKELEANENGIITAITKCHFCDELKECNNSWTEDSFVCEKCYYDNNLDIRERHWK